jgi:ribulose-phosphate 3-epimerase
MLEVDGGIDDVTAGAVVEAGATVLVAGTYVFGAPDIPGAIRSLREHALRSRTI